MVADPLPPVTLTTIVYVNVAPGATAPVGLTLFDTVKLNGGSITLVVSVTLTAETPVATTLAMLEMTSPSYDAGLPPRFRNPSMVTTTDAPAAMSPRFQVETALPRAVPVVGVGVAPEK